MTELEALVERYEHSSPSVRRRGRTWYPEAYRLLSGMAQEHGYTSAQAVAIFAITSMNVQLISNLRYTEQVLRGERLHGCFPKFQAPLIEAALTTRYPGRFVKGPKCSAFYRAIMGDTEALVLDRWAARAAGIDQRRGDLSATTRRILDVAIARRRGCAARQYERSRPSLGSLRGSQHRPSEPMYLVSLISRDRRNENARASHMAER